MYSSGSLPPGLIGYWSLDGDGTDHGPNGLDGAVGNAAWSAGVSNLALRLDGTDALFVADTPILEPTLVSILAWVRPTEYCVTCIEPRVVVNKEDTYEFGMLPSNGALKSAMSPCWRWWGETRLPLHEWTAIAVVYDGFNTLHYLSAGLAEQQVCDGGGDLIRNTATGRSSDFKIGGRDSASAGATFVGDLDEVMLFDRPLSSSSIAGLNALVQRAQVGIQGSAVSARVRPPQPACNPPAIRLQRPIGTTAPLIAAHGSRAGRLRCSVRGRTAGRAGRVLAAGRVRKG